MSAFAFSLWIIWIGGSIVLPIRFVVGLSAIASLILWKIGRHRIKTVLLITVPFGLGLWLVHGGIVAKIIGATIPATDDALISAFGLWVRITSIILASQIWLEYNPTQKLIRSLLASSIPVKITYLLASPLLLKEQIAERFIQIREAQLARGMSVNVSIKGQLASMRALIFPLISSLLCDLLAKSAGLDMKAFTLFPLRSSLNNSKINNCAAQIIYKDGTALELKNLLFGPLKIDNLEIKSGEWILIKGGNGSGKSTLAMIIAGGVPEYRTGELKGSAKIFGVPVSSKTTLQWSQTVQYVQQNPQLSGCAFSVFDEIAFGPENLCLSRCDIIRRVNEAIEISGIHHLRDKNPARLSGGETQKAAIASALAMRPQILVLDEALSRIYSDDIHEICARLKDWSAKNNSAVIFLEKDGQYVKNFCTGEFCLGNISSTAAAPYPKQSVNDAAPKVLEVKDLSFSWRNDDNFLLQSINFTLRKREKAALVGANGVGKSTLIRLCAGLLTATVGNVLIEGENVFEVQPKARASKIGFMFQDAERQIFRPTVADEILFGLEQQEICADEKSARLIKALESTSLVGKEKMHPLDLNAAERRMITAASLSVFNLKLLLLDEPTRDFDDIWLGIFEKWMYSQNAAILCISHDSKFIDRNFSTIYTLTPDTFIKNLKNALQLRRFPS